VTGHATPNAAFPLTQTSSATVAGNPATISYIELTPGFVGLYQANILIPEVNPGERNLTITIGTVASNTTVISTK
jgi:uncharacterized protein (TIGR03437 family)